MSATLRTLRWTLRAVVAVLCRPWLWSTALRQVRVLAAPGWCRRFPFLPLPDRTYLAMRIRTMYGDDRADPTPEDLLTYLHWCRAWSYGVGDGGTGTARPSRRPEG